MQDVELNDSPSSSPPSCRWCSARSGTRRLFFAERWMRAVGRTREELDDAALGYLLSAVAAFVTSYALARIVR